MVISMGMGMTMGTVTVMDIIDIMENRITQMTNITNSCVSLQMHVPGRVGITNLLWGHL